MLLNGETRAPTGQLGIGFDLAVHVARECGPVTDEHRIISDRLINNHDNDLPSDDGTYFLGNVEQNFIVIVSNTEFSPWYGRCKGTRWGTGCNRAWKAEYKVDQQLLRFR